MKMPKKLCIISGVAFLLILWAVAVQPYSRGELRQYKEKAITPPNFTLQDTKGNTHTLNDYRGKYVAIETGSST